MRLVWTITFALFALVVPDAALADEAGSSNWGIALGSGLAIGLAGLGCGIGQGLTGPRRHPAQKVDQQTDGPASPKKRNRTSNPVRPQEVRWNQWAATRPATVQTGGSLRKPPR